MKEQDEGLPWVTLQYAIWHFNIKNGGIMSTFKRYVVREGNRILFFTSKPKRWNRVYWEDYNGYKYRVAGIVPREAPDYEGLLELPEGKAIEVEMRIKVIDK